MPIFLKRLQKSFTRLLAKIKKTKPNKSSSTGIKSGTSDGNLTFSFKFFDASDPNVCPPTFIDGYTQTLMDRLKSLSGWTVSEFLTNRSSALRSHPVDWNKTSKKDGFAHLNEQYDSYEPYQFSISSNSHGRVFGLLIGNCFHIIWLDFSHNVYA